MKIEDEEIPKELANILKSVAELENIKNYDFVSDTNPAKGEGFLSEFFTGEVLDKDTGKIIRVAIKRATTNGLSDNVQNKIIFENEIYFYTEVFPELDKYQREKKVRHRFDHIPRYLAGNVGTTNIFVAMDNLKTKGYDLFDKRKYLDSKHLEYIFKTYGRLHALSFSFKQEHGNKYESLVNKFHDTVQPFMDNEEFIALIEKAYLGALKTFDTVAEAGILEKLNKAKDVKTVFKNAVSYKGSYKCLIHGDCWSNNMLFKYKVRIRTQNTDLI